MYLEKTNLFVCEPMDKVFSSPEAAIADVFDGAVILCGGFAEVGVPVGLILALAKRGVKNLTTVSNECGVSFQKNAPHLGALVENRQVRKMIASFPVSASAARVSAFERQYRAGEIELEMVPQGTLAERIRAGGSGVAAFYTPTGVGTIMEQGKEKRAFDGREYLLERAIKADFAFIHAHKGDRYGNLVYRGTARNFNPVMAMAARVTIAEVEDIVEPGELDPEVIVTPGIFVHRIVKAVPAGGRG